MINNSRSLVIVSLAALVAGCGSVPRQPEPMRTNFNATDYASYLQNGSGSIAGQAFLRQKGGGTVTCAGSDVYLFPETPFFREIVDFIVSNRKPSVAADVRPTIDSLIRKTKCNAQGNFSFGQLSAGSYMIGTDVKWVVGYYQEGGSLLKTVSVSDNQASETILTQPDLLH